MVNEVARVVGGRLPARKGGEPPEDVISKVTSRKATPEELAEIDAAIAKKYSKAEQERDKKKVKAIAFATDLMERSKRNAAKKSREHEFLSRLKECCRSITREQWERMRAFVIVSGAVHGWDEENEDAEKSD